MKNKTITALTAALLSTVALGNETSWMELDQEIASLATTVSAAGDQAALSGYMKSYYTSNSDADVGGWKFSAIRLNAKASVEDMQVKISFDLKDGTAKLKDAYATWKVSDSFDVTMGEFKRPFLWSFTRSGSKLLFVKETASADNEERDQGIQFHGSLGEMGEYFLAATNGDDAAGDDLYYTARVQFDVAGDGAFNKHEGAIDGGEGLHSSVAVSYANENSAGITGTKVGLEAVLTAGEFFLHLETVMHNENFGGVDDSLGSLLADTSPVSATLSYLVRDDVEVALRLEDFDDTDDSSRIKAAVNFYSVLPHKMKWQLNYSDTSSDDTAKESEVIELGFTIAF
jgi:hypothetical protein